MTASSIKHDKPEVVKVLYTGERGEVAEHLIALDDDVKKFIVQQTWGNNHPRLIIVESLGDYEGPADDYAFLAHASAKLLDTPCNNCKIDPILGDCRVNAVWPAEVTCTSCLVTDTDDLCSLDLQTRQRLFPEGVQGVQSQKPISRSGRGQNDITWTKWVKNGLDIIQKQGEKSEGGDDIKLTNEALKKLCELGDIIEKLGNSGKGEMKKKK